MKTTTKTALLLLYTFLILILLFSAFVFYSISRYSHENFYRLLEVKAYTYANTVLTDETGGEINKFEDLRAEFFDNLPERQEFIIPITDDVDLNQDAQNSGLPTSFFENLLLNGAAETKIKNIFFKGVKYTFDGKEYMVIAGAENYLELHQAAFLRRTLFFAIIAAFCFATFLSIYFSANVIKPIKKITDRVRKISSENLHLRLNIHNKNEELKELSKTFNDMLDRIETSFETQNNFISNASHELRTPLTAIIGEADVIISKPRQPEEYVESLKIILDEAEKLDGKTKALLFLAQTGFNGKVQKFDKVRVDQLLWDVKETVERINPKTQIHIDMGLLPENPTKLKVKGNEQLLHLALTNIISNACKYSNYQVVDISIGASDANIVIVVRDRGIGIPESELQYIYDPFFRASNTKNYEGYGIGLPLTRNIIRMHQGEIIVSSIHEGGTTVQINLPIGNYELG